MSIFKKYTGAGMWYRRLSYGLSCPHLMLECVGLVLAALYPTQPPVHMHHGRQQYGLGSLSPTQESQVQFLNLGFDSTQPQLLLGSETAEGPSLFPFLSLPFK